MVFDLAPQSFPITQVVIGTVMLWLGLNISIVVTDGSDIEAEDDGL